MKLLQFLLLTCLGVGNIAGQGVFVCYWQSWSVGRTPPGDFKIEDFDGSLCTHLVFAFAGVRAEDGVIVDLVDPNTYWTLLNWRDTKYPDLKVLLAVGGWNEGAAKFSQIANSAEKRINFAKSAADFCRRYGFDGIDMDWEYPGEDRFDSPGEPYDKENFPKLLTDMKKALKTASDDMGKTYLLTAAVGCGASKVNQSYDVPAMDENLDFFHLMAYDLRMYGVWSEDARRIGHHAPLRRSSREGPSVEGLNIEEIVQNFLDLGATPSKLVLGVGTYGKTYALRSRAEHNFWDFAAGPGVAEPFQAEAGTMPYSGICYQIPLSKSNFEIHYDQETDVPFAFNDTLWIGYDNPESAEKKTDLAFEEGLGGMMVWSIDLDDCKNLCQDWYNCPIMTAIRDRMRYLHTQRGGWPKSV